ncbi:MAG: hypothetical protein ONB05_07945 [candidate division KSB1 bacterium]|nr:hypothetical protein [candidate division KSB1 bacterium]
MEGPIILDKYHWHLIKRFHAFLKPQYRLWWLSVILMLVSLVFSLPMPWISMKEQLFPLEKENGVSTNGAS